MPLKLHEKLLVRVAAVIPFIAALSWSRVVLFTSDREHLHFYLVIATMTALWFSVLLFSLNKWAIALSWFLAGGLGILSGALLITTATLQPTFLAVAVASTAYAVLLSPMIRLVLQRARK